MESFVPLLASLGVSLNMPLFRAICVTHYTGFPFGSASFTELLCWFGTVLSALPSLLAGTLSPCVDPGWASSASLPGRSGQRIHEIILEDHISGPDSTRWNNL